MNTEEDWKREREEGRSCRACNGRGWVIDRNAPSGGSPCGCDEPQEDDDTQPGIFAPCENEPNPPAGDEVSSSARNEAYAWASEWQGMGGLSHALHDTEQEAADNADWMAGRSFPLFTHPIQGEAEGMREKVASPLGRERFRSIVIEALDRAYNAGSDFDQNHDSRQETDAILASLKSGGEP